MIDTSSQLADSTANKQEMHLLSANLRNVRIKATSETLINSRLRIIAGAGGVYLRQYQYITDNESVPLLTSTPSSGWFQSTQIIVTAHPCPLSDPPSCSSIATSAPSLDISEKASRRPSKSESRLSARDFI
jgi:hypothetical protein